jgi:hypothetical protein
MGYHNTWNLDIGFPSGPMLEKITYESKPLPGNGYWLRVDDNYSDSLIPFELEIHTPHRSWKGLLTELQVKDERTSIPDKYYPENSNADNTRLEYADYELSFVEMDGIVYFTRPNYNHDLLLYTIIDSDCFFHLLTYPVEYTAMSGIWAFDETSGASPENVVPYLISSDSTSTKVYGIYAAEAESAIILLTVENGVDLYATVYDTKTKTTHDPVLIFHSDSGDINPRISNVNNTCPMGSIVVEVLNDDSEWFALALGKNAINGNIETVSYDIAQAIPVLVLYDYYDINETLGYTEFFYRGEETWIINDVTNYSWSSSNLRAQPSLDTPNFYYSNQDTQEIRIVGVKEDTIFYEGTLSFDLTAAYIDSKLKNYAKYYSYQYYANQITTQIEMY